MRKYIMPMNNINLKGIQNALESLESPWRAGEAAISLLTTDKKKLRLGVTPPPHEQSLEDLEQYVKGMKQSIQQQVLQADTPPTKYDWRNVNGENFITPIKDQKNCGSCVAFGTLATLESQWRIQNNDPNKEIDLSEAQLFFCYGYNEGRNCNNGWWPANAYEDLRIKGIVDESCYSYSTGLAKQNCRGLCSDANNRLVKITGYTDLTQKPAAIKQWIATKGPVSACFNVYEDFYYYQGGVYRHITGASLGGHCVTIIGYDDQQGCWICKNSWGEQWGEKGFFRIAYGECGIDSWANHGVDGIMKNQQLNDDLVTGLWAHATERNAWVYLKNTGWRKINAGNDTIFLSMLTQLITAKASGCTVQFTESNQVLTDISVFSNQEIRTEQPSFEAQLAYPTQLPPTASNQTIHSNDTLIKQDNVKVDAVRATAQSTASLMQSGDIWKNILGTPISSGVALSMLASHACEHQRTVNYTESNGTVKEMYVW